MDFSKNENILSLHKEIIDFNPHRLIYCAGGGPYGFFHKKTWQSHAWSFQLNFLFPGELLHTLLSEKSENISNLKQLVFIGSTIAEDQPDPFAASYAAGKHALKGLISSLVEESKSPLLKDFTPWDIRLYSPGYMDTSLLPAQSLPRKQNEKILLKPENVAEDVLTWMSQPLNDTHWHRKVPNESLLTC